MMKQKSWLLVILLTACLGTACQQGTANLQGPSWQDEAQEGLLPEGGEDLQEGVSEAGNPQQLRPVIGVVINEDPDVVACGADIVIATTKKGESVEFAVGADCDFFKELGVGEEYSLALIKDEQALPEVMFKDMESGELSKYFLLPSGEGPFDLGIIVVALEIMPIEIYPNYVESSENAEASTHETVADSEQLFSDKYRIDLPGPDLEKPTSADKAPPQAPSLPPIKIMRHLHHSF